MKFIPDVFRKSVLTIMIAVLLTGISCRQSSSELPAEEIKLPVDNSFQTEEIINTVKDFWRCSIDGDKSKVRDRISEMPERFLKNYFDKSANDSNIVDLSISEGTFPKGKASKISLTEIKSEYFLLTYFSELIKDRKYKLFGVKTLKSNEDEAVIKVSWGREKDSSFSIQELWFLHKENGDWRIFMIGNSTKLEHYRNKDFAQRYETAHQ